MLKIHFIVTYPFFLPKSFVFYGNPTKQNMQHSCMKRKNILPPHQRVSTIQTVDTMHSEMLAHFQELTDVTIPALMTERLELKEKYHRAVKLEVKLEARDRIYRLTERIQSMRAEKKTYLLRNSKYIFSYFENKQNISMSGENDAVDTDTDTHMHMHTRDESDDMIITPSHLPTDNNDNDNNDCCRKQKEKGHGSRRGISASASASASASGSSACSSSLVSASSASAVSSAALNTFFRINSSAANPQTVSTSAITDNNTMSADAATTPYQKGGYEDTYCICDANGIMLPAERFAHMKQWYQTYWKNVKNEITNMQDFVFPTDVCMYCERGELIPQEDEGVLICNNTQCGKFIMHMVDGAKPNNKEPPNEVSYTVYIRLNHFKEILSQFQAKETTLIPAEVMDAIRNRIKKERITNLVEEINYDKMREILKKLGFNKYFEHIQYINSILGIKPPIMNQSLHETLCNLFIEIQKPWAVHCPANRTNFFNYTYTLYQLCVLLNQTQYLPYIPMMKDRDKQIEQDQIWQKVCKDMGWLFFPSI